MGHNVRYEDYPLNVDKKQVQSGWDEYVRHEDWGEGASGLPNSIRWLDRTFDSYEAARSFIEKQDERIWYNCMAVKYKDVKHDALRSSKPSKKETELIAAIKAQRENLDKITRNASVQNRTSEYIGCEKCGSKLKRTLLRSQFCPLCGNDLRSKTNLDRIANAGARLDELIKKRDLEEEKRLDGLKKTSSEIRWLVKVEYHT
jgi:hypothetical protein